MNKHHITEEERFALSRWKAETGITNEQIGRIAGVSKISVAKWISGKTKSMKIKSFVSLAQQLNEYKSVTHHKFPVNIYFSPQFKSQALAALFGDEVLQNKVLTSLKDLYDESLTKQSFMKMLKQEEYLDPMAACILIVELDLKADELDFNNTEKKLLYGLSLVRKLLKKHQLLIKVPGQPKSVKDDRSTHFFRPQE